MKTLNKVAVSFAALPIMLGGAVIIASPAQAAQVCWTAANGSTVCQDDGSGGQAPGAGGTGGDGGSGFTPPPAAAPPAQIVPGNGINPYAPSPYRPPSDTPASYVQPAPEPARVVAPPVHIPAPAPQYVGTPQGQAPAASSGGYVGQTTPNGPAPASGSAAVEAPVVTAEVQQDVASPPDGEAKTAAEAEVTTAQEEQATSDENKSSENEATASPSATAAGVEASAEPSAPAQLSADQASANESSNLKMALLVGAGIVLSLIAGVNLIGRSAFSKHE